MWGAGAGDFNPPGSADVSAAMSSDALASAPALRYL
jgi:hypothetical protein